MDSTGQTRNQAEADAFFARLLDPSDTVRATIAAERGGNLAAVVAEQAAFGYWDRTLAERRARQRAAAATRQIEAAADAARVSQPNPEARRATPAAAALLPGHRIATIDDADRRATVRWWRSIRNAEQAARLGRRLTREAREAEAGQRRTALALRRERETWQAEQRAFERAQWRAVLRQQADRRRKRITNQWIAIDEQRALEIAAAVLARRSPPQGH